MTEMLKKMTAEKEIIEKLKREPIRQFNNAFALMTVIPLLVIAYILTMKFYLINVFLGDVGLTFTLAIAVALTGYVLTREILNKMVYSNLYLKKHDSEKNIFLAGVTHDLRNFLSILRGNIEVIRGEDYGKVNGKQKQVLKSCSTIVGRMTGVTDILKKVEEYKAFESKDSREKCDLSRIVEGQAVTLESQMRDKNISFNISRQGDDLSLWADKYMISQIVDNLLFNAVKFTPENGAINVMVSEKDKALELVVHNTGSYIKKNDLRKVFEKYVTLGDKESGNGLGLSIVDNIVAIHRGKVWAESHPKEGTRFHVELPRDLREKSPKDHLNLKNVHNTHH
jgi:two-component system sensor histidine kinase BaeS